MRSLMLALGACLFALNFAGCSSTGSCGVQQLLGGGNVAGNKGCSGGCGESACSGGGGESSCSGGCGESSHGNAIANKNFGGQSGLGLGLMEPGPSCKEKGCNGGCKSCQRQKLQRPKLQLGSRMKSRLANRGGSSDCGCGGGGSGGCGGSSDCGCGGSTPAPEMPESGCGCSAPTAAPAAASGCGCTASAPVEVSMGDSCDSCEFAADIEAGSDIQLTSHNDRGGLFGKMGFGKKALGKSHTRQVSGCGVHGCGGRAGLCSNCLSRLRAGAGGGLGLGGGLAGRGASTGPIPHRDPSIHGGGQAGPAGQVPTYAYPYYTTRAPRDFLDPNPPTIGY